MAFLCALTLIAFAGYRIACDERPWSFLRSRLGILASMALVGIAGLAMLRRRRVAA